MHLDQLNTKTILYLTEAFVSVQGETSFTGLPTTFIRLSACNLRCTWCDTSYSFQRGTSWEIEDIVQYVEQQGCSHVCITGGEPLLQPNVYLLMQLLCEKGFTLSLETSGSLPINQVDPRVHIILDVKCPGSGMQHKNDWSNLSQLSMKDEVKFVLLDESDYDYAKEICVKFDLYKQVKEILFAPVHGKIDPPQLIAWILRDRLPVRLNLQLHKYIWDPLKRGV